MCLSLCDFKQPGVCFILFSLAGDVIFHFHALTSLFAAVHAFNVKKKRTIWLAMPRLSWPSLGIQRYFVQGFYNIIMNVMMYFYLLGI